LQHVFELPYVARPIVGLEHAHHFRWDRVDALAQSRSQTRHEVTDEKGNIAPAISKRWQRDGKYIEPVEEVAAESTLADFVGQVAVRRRHDSHVDIDRARVPKPLDLPFLNDPEKAWLQFERQLADLVQKHGAPIGQLESTDLRRIGPGERSAFAAEQLAFDERCRQGRAVDDDERPVAAGAEMVDSSGQKFFAGSCFTAQEDRCIGRRHLLGSKDGVFEGIALAHDRVRAVHGRTARARDRWWEKGSVGCEVGSACWLQAHNVLILDAFSGRGRLDFGRTAVGSWP
jgi:hypothetical protein